MRRRCRKPAPSDVIQAIRAFNDMQDRIRRFVEDRTRMIAAISHDLRTPITRMRLRAELIGESEQQQKMLADLAEMETMIASTLSFAREDANPEPRQRVDLVELLQAVCADIPQAKLSMEPPPAPVLIDAQPVALRRGFTNLIDNAVRYGGEARIALGGDDRNIIVTIDDKGPGIPDEQLDRVFRPFYRLRFVAQPRYRRHRARIGGGPDRVPRPWRRCLVVEPERSGVAGDRDTSAHRKLVGLAIFALPPLPAGVKKEDQRLGDDRRQRQGHRHPDAAMIDAQ